MKTEGGISQRRELAWYGCLLPERSTTRLWIVFRSMMENRMKFETVATHLLSLHNQLWFRTADGITACQDNSAWRASEILTTEGRIVAMQTYVQKALVRLIEQYISIGDHKQ